MGITEEKKEKISHVIISVLYSRFENFPEDSLSNRNAPFHMAFLEAFSDKIKDQVSDIPFFISMSSWLHGLNTTLGQTFFEKTAHILSDGEKREYTSKKIGNLKVSGVQKANISTIITNLSNGINKPNLEKENLILLKKDNSKLVNALDFSTDVFIDDDEEVVAVELKSVKPNSGEMRGEKHKILEGKSAFFNIYPNKRIKFLLGFPFDPTSTTSTGYDKKRFMNSIINLNKYFEECEVLLASELWDYLSGTKKTMEMVLEIINNISTPEFINKYKFINNINNISSDKYIKYLREWNLHSLLRLVKRDEELKKIINRDKRLTKIYNQQIFQNGYFNNNRSEKLKDLLK